MATARSKDQYITLVAEEALAIFMVKQWPDDKLFSDLVTELITRARANGRPVRAFGEMVALLWARGDEAATIRLEYRCIRYAGVRRFRCSVRIPRQGLPRLLPNRWTKSVQRTPGLFD